jgi:prepilin-type N-terminal cleavage/methylation domain-containing protein/prepilin-type processing-associated H-X9-DG protein
MSTVSRRAAARRKKGFTLVELLVVIGIIAILAAILFPSFAAAQKSAKGTVCVNQLKQVNLALTYYEQAYDNRLPTTAGLSSNPQLQIPVAWYAANNQPDYWGETIVPVAGSTTPGPTGKQLVDQLKPWVKSPDVWFCPLVRTDVQAHLAPSDGAAKDASGNDTGVGAYWTYKRIRTTYLFNQYTIHLPGDPEGPVPGIVHGGRKVDSALDASTAVTVWDDPCCSTPILETWWGGLPHNNGVNVGYADGHVAYVPVLNPASDYNTDGTLKPVAQQTGNAWCCSGVLETGWDK